jgi:hypothetical protein
MLPPLEHDLLVPVSSAPFLRVAFQPARVLTVMLLHALQLLVVLRPLSQHHRQVHHPQAP